jgi:hypothetical protein
VEALGNIERLDRPGGTVHVAFLLEQAAVDQHAHRLDRVERNPLGAVQDRVVQVRREAGDKARQQVAHRPRRKWLQVQGADATLAGAPARPLVGELRAGERQHEERVAA